MMQRTTYIVCATPRSGSTLLCELLKSTGVAGHPEEYFEARADTGLPPHPGEYLEGLPRTGAGVRDNDAPPEPPAYSDLRGVSDYREHLERSFRLGTTANGVFATKLMWRNLADLHRLATQLPEYDGLGEHELLEALFGGVGGVRYVWMTRREKLRQAISLWRALQTRTWRLEHPGAAANDESLHYSYEAIDHLSRQLSADDERWGAYLSRHRPASISVVYEDDLEHHQQDTIERVLEHLGVQAPRGWQAPVRTYRQADALTERWVDEYRREQRRRDSAAPGTKLERRQAVL